MKCTWHGHLRYMNPADIKTTHRINNEEHHLKKLDSLRNDHECERRRKGVALLQDE